MQIIELNRCIKREKEWNYRSIKLTWDEEGNIVITTSLASATSKGVSFVGTPMSENFFMALQFLKMDQTFHINLH